MHGKVVTAAIVVVAAAGVGWGASWASTKPVAVPTRAALSVATEQEWIVADITRVISEGAAEARRSSQEAGPQIAATTAAATAADLLKSASVQVVVDGKRMPPIDIVEHVWRADNYTGIARALLDEPARHGTSPSSESRVLAALTEPRLNVLLSLEGTISTALATDPGDPQALEDAALLTAYLGMREAAKQLTDVRPLLNRATAHLALAQARSTPGAAPSVSGKMAGIVIDALAGRGDLALDALDRWSSSTAGLQAWKAAIRYRVTADWRTPPGEHATLLERVAYGRAVRVALGASRFLDKFDTEAGEESDWHRIGLQAGWTGPTIEADNLFVPLGFERELSEIDVVWRHYHSGEPTFDTLIQSLAEDGPQEFRAMDWFTWAELLQRHLSAHLLSSAYQMFHQGREKQSEEWLDAVSPRFGALRWFPLIVAKLTPSQERYRMAYEQMRTLQRTQPQLLTPRMITYLNGQGPNAVKAEVFPRSDAWFTPHVPTGTAFDLEYRSLVEGCPRPVPVSQVARWAAMRRGDMWPAWSLAWLSVPGKPSFNDVQTALAQMLPYDARASKLMLDYLEGSSNQYESTERTLCRLDVDACAALGWRLLAGERPVEAATVYDDYATRARDRVAVSSSLDWLISYHWDNGRRDRAVELAREAGHTGSASGLRVYGEILEREGQLDEAQRVFDRIRERYNDGTALAAHYMRLSKRSKNRAFLDKAATFVKDLYPNGIELVDSNWLSAAPSDGVVFATFTRRAKTSGLRPDDIIVGVDGVRVHSYGQYSLVAKSSFEPKMTFLVWRDGRPQQVNALVPQRTLGVGMGNHPAPRPPQVLD